jgi:sigma-E factor negative regulatory protein RseA
MPATPRQSSDSSPDPADWLSAAADGDADALDRACRAFRDGDSRVRADWHAYHLIGDVLRSSELAAPPAREAAFLAGFRDRFAAEPVVMAPAAVAASAASDRPMRRAASWRRPAAAVASAAGVAVVAGVLVMARSGADSAGAAAVTLATAPQLQPGAVVPTLLPTLVKDGYIRDARIEEFMRVHQGAAGGLSLPSTDVRQVDVVVAPAR